MSFQTTSLNNIPGNNISYDDGGNILDNHGWHAPNKAVWGVIALVFLLVLLGIIYIVRTKKSSKNTEPKDRDEAKDSEQTKESDDATSKV